MAGMTQVLDRIADLENSVVPREAGARPSGGYLRWEAAPPTRCLPSRAALPERRAPSGPRPGTLLLRGWSGWRGDFRHGELAQMLNNRALPQGRPLDQQCMVYRYRFIDRPAAYIGSVTGQTTVRQRVREEVSVGPRGRVRPARGMPAGLEQIAALLSRPEQRAGFRFDIGTIVPPGVRNSPNVFILEKMLQAQERPSGNPLSVRSFDEDWFM